MQDLNQHRFNSFATNNNDENEKRNNKKPSPKMSTCQMFSSSFVLSTRNFFEAIRIRQEATGRGRVGKRGL